MTSAMCSHGALLDLARYRITAKRRLACALAFTGRSYAQNLSPYADRRCVIFFVQCTVQVRHSPGPQSTYLHRPPPCIVLRMNTYGRIEDASPSLSLRPILPSVTVLLSINDRTDWRPSQAIHPDTGSPPCADTVRASHRRNDQTRMASL
ncbi:hypothetical protein FKP32DRAFT_1144898 [Trametes sanguinea]|nr:hypothetical protein FKP32DRAFT_1144898 [Trametes sanguinea]